MTDAPTAAGTLAFVPGDLVISLSGDGDGSGAYADNQAAPITLEQIAPDGTLAGRLVLPQSATVSNGVTSSAISGEYGSSSEGSLERSADGHSLVIAGYGVNAATFNAAPPATYGTAALAQTTSIPGGTLTAVTRVIADIRADGSVDTSTALYGVANTNNPRSAATVDGSSFYLSGQGVKGDATQGVFLAADGATQATAIDTSTDTRTLEIANGQLIVSRDSKQGTGGTANIATYGALPTTATAPAILPGISQTVTLTAAQANTVNAAAVGTAVHLSPENFFLADASTLYVADAGNPKQGGPGDGGLQKWSLAGGAWHLDYTLSAGLGLVPDTASAGTTGLIGLAGTVTGDTVRLYATSATIGDTDPTSLVAVTDTLSATTGAGETFATLVTAPADTNIRGVALAPTAPCYAAGTRLRTPDGERRVDDVRPGDTLLTAAGRHAPVRWVGHRRVRCHAHPAPDTVNPVRIHAHAFGPGLPARDLLLSPEHALFLGGALVPAGLLVDNRAVTRDTPAEVTYFHVELDRHDILLAEGLPAESYLDTGNRAQFANAPVTTLHASFAPGHDAAEPCAPLALHGPALDAARATLAAFTPLDRAAG
ncbi:MAG: Hint domain-containing protein [Janthinobacterium lividum]